MDNCCNIRAKLQEICGPNVQIKLDIYHWLVRWDDIILDKKLERYPVFKRLMNQSVLQASVLENIARRQRYFRISLGEILQ